MALPQRARDRVLEVHGDRCGYSRSQPLRDFRSGLRNADPHSESESIKAFRTLIELPGGLNSGYGTWSNGIEGVM